MKRHTALFLSHHRLLEWQSPVLFFNIGTSADLIWLSALHNAHAHMYTVEVDVRRRVGTISVDLSLFVLL